MVLTFMPKTPINKNGYFFSCKNYIRLSSQFVIKSITPYVVDEQ